MQVTALNLYPIKSTQAYRVEQAFVRPQGLNFDREFMITEQDGRFITARKEHVLYQLAAFPVPEGVIICFQQEQCLARYADFTQSQSCEVWGTHFVSYVADERVNQWLSHILQRQVQFRWLGQQSSRTVANFADHPMSFGDSNPILLCTEASLVQVQQWSPVPLSMAQFRPNIVINGETAFEEETWRELEIGEVKFAFSRHCTRCIMINRDVQTFEMNEQAEPLRTLKQHHTDSSGKPIFGIHLVPQNSGIIRVGDSVRFR